MEHEPTAPAARQVFTPRVIVASGLVAVIMGVSYPYMVLKLGFGPNVSVVAAFFGFILLNLFGPKHYDRWKNNIVETAGTSAAQTAFMCVLLGAFDLLRHKLGPSFPIHLTPVTSFIWLTVACTLGVLLAVPLRQHFIVDEQLTYPDGVAAAETLLVLDPPRNAPTAQKHQAYRAAVAMMGGVFISALLMYLREDGQIHKLLPEGWHPNAVVGGVALASMGVGVSFSVLSVGSGMLIGLRICFSMLLGGLLAWAVVPGQLVEHGVIASPAKKLEVLTWVMWPATGMLVASGLAALALRWRILVKTFTSLRSANLSGDEFPLRWVLIGAGVCTVLLCIVQYKLLHMPIWMTLIATALSLPLMLVGLRVLGETGWGPISALSNMMQGFFAALAPGQIGPNMVASGTTGTIATSSEAIMQDYKAAHMLESTPKSLTLAQLAAVPIGAAAVSWMYPVLVSTYGIVDRVDAATGKTIEPQLSSPISKKWAYFAELLQQGFDSLPVSAKVALLVFSVLGVVFTVLEGYPKLRPWVPSPTGIGIGILVPFSVVATMFVGAVVELVWTRGHRRSADHYLTPVASGLIAGEAIMAVILSIYLYARG